MPVSARFLLDPGLPRGMARSLRARGIDVVNVEEAGARVRDAAAILTAAGDRVVVTRDVALAAAERPEQCPGVLLVSLPASTPDAVVTDAVAEAVRRYVETQE